MTLSLRVFPSILISTGGPIVDVTSKISGWRRSVRRKGGYWLGDFSITGDEKELSTFFYSRLGGHVTEHTDGYKTWEGMIYEMDLTYKSRRNSTQLLTRRRSLDLLYNYVSGNVIGIDGTQTSLSVAQNEQSVAQYGRREQQLSLTGTTAAAGNARRDTYLTENQWPWARVVSVTPRVEVGDALLEVYVCGYALTANWRYRTAGDNSTGNVSDFIKSLIDTDCQFLESQDIKSNTLQVTKGTAMPMRVGDLLFTLVDLGDANGNPWILNVGNERKATYAPVDFEPSYYLRGGNLYLSAGASIKANPWLMKPGVVRDLTYPVSSTEYGSVFQDARDFYISEVEVGTGAGVVLKTELFEESEILAAQSEYEAQFIKGGVSDTGTGGGGSGGGGGGGRLNWKRKWNLPEDQWKDFDPKSKGFWNRKQAWIAEQKAKKKAKKGKTGKKKKDRD